MRPPAAGAGGERSEPPLMIVKKMLTRRLVAAAEFRGERLLDLAVSWLIAGRERGGGLS